MYFCLSIFIRLHGLICYCFDAQTVQVNAAAEVIYDLVDPAANLIFGAVIDQSFSGQVS